MAQQQEEKFSNKIFEPDFSSELPEIDFAVSASGITIHSKRFKEARFLEFDVKGRCKLCKSNTVDVEYYVTEGGLEVCSSRFKTRRFIFFDNSAPLPNRAIFWVRSKGVRYNYDIKNEETIQISGFTSDLTSTIDKTSLSKQTSTNHQTSNNSEETKL